jgi:putative FmdB family regulatory protein
VCTGKEGSAQWQEQPYEVLNMPIYEYKCLDCGKKVILALTLKEHESGSAKCPACGSKRLEQLITSFIARTSKKS